MVVDSTFGRFGSVVFYVLRLANWGTLFLTSYDGSLLFCVFCFCSFTFRFFSLFFFYLFRECSDRRVCYPIFVVVVARFDVAVAVIMPVVTIALKERGYVPLVCIRAPLF